METIAVIFGGRSAEHDVSIVTALATIIKPLELTKKYHVEAIYIDKDGSWYWDEKLKNIQLFTSGEIQDFLHKMCIRDSSKSDQQTIQDAYLKNTFFKVTSTSSDNVNGQNADKYMTTVDNDKAAAFINQLESSTIGKSAKSCGSSSSSNSSPTPAKGDGKTENMTFWVDKVNNRIVQVYFKPQAQNISGTKTSGDLSLSFGYTVPPIQAPTGALPAEQVINQLAPAFSAPPSGPSTLGKLSKPPKPINLNTAARIFRQAL